MTPDHTPNIGGDCGQSADSADNLRTGPTPETDAEWDRLQMLPGGGYSSRPAGIKLAFGMAGLAAQLERQRNEAREQLDRICRDGFGYQDTVGGEACADYVLRKLNEERELARELRDLLQDWRRFWKDNSTKSSSATWSDGQGILTSTVRLIDKAKEVLP